MSAQPRISDSRKSLHAFGTILVVIGAAATVGGVISFVSSFGSPQGMFAESFPPKGFLIAGGGILLTGIGRGLRHLGARGIAGSGLVAGDDGDVPAGATNGGATGPERVKIRCRECRALHDEDARFCDQCGASL